MQKGKKIGGTHRMVVPPIQRKEFGAGWDTSRPVAQGKEVITLVYWKAPPRPPSTFTLIKLSRH